MQKAIRVVYFGSSGALSLRPLQALLANPDVVLSAAVVVSAPSESISDSIFSIIDLDQQDLARYCALQAIPVFTLAAGWPVLIEKLKPMPIDLILVSCFAKKLPAALLALPRFGCFNLHPSLLPQYRGPEPLFWQLRDGVDEFALTLHRIDNTWDGGDIVAQTQLVVPDGITLEQLNTLLAEQAHGLFDQLLACVLAGKAIAGQKQDALLASYQSFSTPSDYHLDAQWSAQRIYNFVKATQTDKSLYQLWRGRERLLIRDVVAYSTIDIDTVVAGGRIVRCGLGSIVVEICDDFDF